MKYKYITTFLMCLFVHHLISQINTGNLYYQIHSDTVVFTAEQIPFLQLKNQNIPFDSVTYQYHFINLIGNEDTLLSTNNSIDTFLLPYCSNKLIRKILGYKWGNVFSFEEMVGILKIDDIPYIKPASFDKSKFSHTINGSFKSIEMIVTDIYNVEGKSLQVLGQPTIYGGDYDNYTTTISEKQSFFVFNVNPNTNSFHVVTYLIKTDKCSYTLSGIIYL